MLKSYSITDVFKQLKLDIFNITSDVKQNPFIKGSSNKDFVLDVDNIFLPEKEFLFLTTNFDDYLVKYPFPDDSISFPICHYDKNNNSDIRKTFVNLMDLMFIIRPDFIDSLIKNILDSITLINPIILNYEDVHGEFCHDLHHKINTHIHNKKEFESLYSFLNNKKIRKKVSDHLYQNNENFKKYFEYNESLIYIPFILKSVSEYTLNKHILYYLENNINFGNKPYSFGLNDYNLFRINDDLLTKQSLEYLSLIDIQSYVKPVVLQHKNMKNDFGFTRPNKDELGKSNCFYLNIHELFLLKNKCKSSEMENIGIFIRKNIMNDILVHIKERIANYKNLTEINRKAGYFISYDKEIQDIMKISSTLEKILLNYEIKENLKFESKKRL